MLCDRYFWILLCKATTWSKKICDKALNDDLYAHAVNEIAKGMSARGSSSSMAEETKTEGQADSDLSVKERHMWAFIVNMTALGSLIAILNPITLNGVIRS